MNSRIMTGNNSVVRVVACVLILCFLLSGCSGKTDSYEDDRTGNETVSDITTDPTGTTGTTSAIIDDEETQSNTMPLDNTMPDDKFVSEDSVSSTESPEKPNGSSTATTPASRNDDTSDTGPSTTPTDNTTTTTPGDEGNDMPDYGIELPDDNWD